MTRPAFSLSVTIAVFLASPLLSAKDYNGLGFAAFKKGQYPRAHALFQKSIEKQPKAHFGWLNLARTTYQLNNEKIPDDECSREGSWYFETLYLLSRAVELNAEQILDKLDNGTEEFGFKASDHYKKWRSAAGINAPAGNDLEALISAKQWWPYTNGFPAFWLSFTSKGKLQRETYEDESNAGTWTVSGADVVVTTIDGKTIKLRASAQKSYFNQGKSWHWQLQLSTSDNSAAPWQLPLVLGPRVGDCGQYNF